jgi:hypothetical protein
MEDEIGRTCSMHWEKRHTWDFGGRARRERLLGRLRCRWEGNIKMDLREIGCCCMTGLIRLRIGTSGGFF